MAKVFIVEKAIDYEDGEIIAVHGTADAAVERARKVALEWSGSMAEWKQSKDVSRRILMKFYFDPCSVYVHEFDVEG